MHPELAEAIRRAAASLRELDRSEFLRRLESAQSGGLAADLLQAGVFKAREEESESL